MRKKFLSLLTALCLTLALAPAAFAADANDLPAQLEAAEAGETLILREDVTLSEPLVIDKDITIDGGEKYSITYIDTATEKTAILIEDNANVTLKGVTLNATETGCRGIRLDSDSIKLTIQDSIINVAVSGILVNNAGLDSEGSITLENSTIQNSMKPADKTYENWSALGDYRGISLWNLNGATVSIKNSDILGFGYSLNLAGSLNEDGVRDAKGAKIEISDNSNIWGWTALNIWTCNTNFEITDSDLRGISVSNGSSDDFAAIVFNDDIYGGTDVVHPENALPNTLTMSGGSIGGYQYGSANEYLIRVGNQLATIFKFEISPTTLERVKFNSNVPNYAFYFTYNPNMTDDDINGYLYDTVWVSGLENIDTMGLRGENATLMSVADWPLYQYGEGK